MLKIEKLKNINVNDKPKIGFTKIGDIMLSYNQLVKMIGEPSIIYSEETPNETSWYRKTDVDWFFKYGQNYIEIYNYKNGPFYNPDKYKNLEEIKYFSIGISGNNIFKDETKGNIEKALGIEIVSI